MSGAELGVGSRFGRYHLRSLLGRGGMGVVYLADDEQLGRRVAVKVIAPEAAEDLDFRERFLRESRLAASVDHPNVIPVHEAGDRDGVLYLVMRYVDGDDLKVVLLRDGRLDVSRAVSVITQAAAALDAAHANGLVHRDVKPANILIAEAAGGEHVYLTDFGLTKRADSRSLTATGEMVGTLDYLSPEQIQGGAVDRRADVYALGCVLYQCLSGQTPYAGNEAAVILAHLQDGPPSLSGIRPDVPAGVDAVVTRAMAKDRESRYASAGELATALREAVAEQAAAGAEQMPTESVPVSSPRRRPRSGATAETRRERKLVSVVAVELTVADDVDIEDAEAVLDAGWGEVRERLERSGAIIFASGGESLRAAFGMPVAHEDDPERAVRAALAVRDAMTEQAGAAVGVRIGVATGEAFVTFVADPKPDATVTGEVVAAAARLQAAAPTGAVLVSDASYRMTMRAIEYDPEGPAWIATGARSRFGSDVGQVPENRLVGRERQLELLWSALEQARQEGEPQLVTLVGVPGIGKSRLVWELFQRIDRQADLITWRQGRSLPYGEGVTFWALAEIVSAQAGVLQSDTAATAAGKVHEAVADVIADQADAAWVEGHLRPLAGAGADATAGDRLAEAFAAWRRFIEALAETRPTVLVFEDLHWADDVLLDFIDGLVDRVTGVPLLVVCTARPELLERRTGWGGGKINASTVALPPLSESDTARLVAALLEQTVLPADIQSALLTRADGNPLYAEEYVRMLIDRQILVRSGGYWRAAEGIPIPLPDTVQSLIAARLDTLSDLEKAVIQAAAVMGKVFWLGAIQVIAGLPRVDVEECLHRLVRKEFIRRERRSTIADETEYAFRHVLLGDVAYAQIARPDRALGHGQAAEWIDSLSGDRDDRVEMLAHHYVAALELARASGGETEQLEQGARRALREAGDRALELSAFAAAARFYGSALDLWPGEAPGRALVLFGLGKAQYHLENRLSDALMQAADYLAGLAEYELAAEAQTMIGLHLTNHGSVPEGMSHLSVAAGFVAELPPSRQKAWALTSLAGGHILSGENIEHGVEVASTAAEVARQIGLDDLRAEALIFIGFGRQALDDREGLTDIETALDLVKSRRSTPGLLCYANAADCFDDLGERARSIRLRTEARRRAEELDSAFFIRGLGADDLGGSYHAGKWSDVVEGIDLLLSEAAAGNPILQEARLRILRGYIHLARGEPTKALVHAQVGARWVEHSFIEDLVPARAFLARSLLAIGDPIRARDEARRTIGQAHVLGSIRSAKGTGDLAHVTAAVGLTNEFVALARSFKIETAWCRAAMVISAGDFAHAAEIYRDMGCLPDEAYARLQSGRKLLLEGGHQIDARHELEQALAFWRSVDATAYIRECEVLIDEAATG